MSLQDNSQNEGLAQGLTAQDPNTSAGNNQATGNDQVPAPTPDQNIDPQSHNKLKADYQANLGRLRSTQNELNRYQQEMQAYKQRESELASRLEKLESMSRQQTPTANKLDYSTMQPDDIVKHITEAGATEGEKRAWDRFQKYMQEREQGEQTKQREAQVAQEEERYQKSWDEVFALDPEVDVEEIESFMKQERIFNPKWAYQVMNQDLLKQQVAAKASKETLNKVATNKRTFTEGPGKVGATPPVKPDWSNKASRKSYLKQQMMEGLSGAGADA